MKLSFFRSGQRRPHTVLPPPTGTIVAFAGSSVPGGWLLCDGTAVSQTTYAALYAIFGANRFGTDSGGNFALPDFRQRAPMGYGTGDQGSGAVGGTGRILPLGSSMTNRALGTAYGSASMTLTASQATIGDHPHTVTEANHTHTLANFHKHQNGSYYNSGAGQYPAAKSGSQTMWTEGRMFGYVTNGSYETTGPQTAATFSISTWIASGTYVITCSSTTNANAASPHPCVQPSLVVNYIVKT